LKVPPKEIRHKDVSKGSGVYNPHFNHPCGIQIYKDYLVVPAIPFHTANALFYDSALIYVYDLTPLKRASPQAPSRLKEIMRVPKVNGASLSCAGIIRLPDNRYALGHMTDSNLDVYLSTNKTDDLLASTWASTPNYKYKLKASAGNNKYQGIGFLLNENSDLYMIGFDTRNAINKDDYADLYALTGNRIWKNSGTLQTIAEKHLIGGQGARFTYGGALEIRPQGMTIYSIESKYTAGGFRINYWT
jgi:hypothetical protein